MERVVNIICIIFFVSELILLIVKRSKPSETNIKQDKQSILVLWVVIILALVASVYTSAIFPMQKSLPVVQYAGIFLLILGLIIRWIAIYQLGKAFTVDVAVSSTQKIKDTGLYKTIRHPSYTGLLLAFLGLSMLFTSWFSVFIINIPIIIALSYRIKVEENLLSAFFGADYISYKKRTNRIIPYLW